MKYTVVYSDYFMSGSHNHAVTKYIHVTVAEGSSLEKELNMQGLESTQVWFIFPGHIDPVVENSDQRLAAASMHARKYAELMGVGKIDQAQSHMQDMWKVLVPDLCESRKVLKKRKRTMLQTTDELIHDLNELLDLAEEAAIAHANATSCRTPTDFENARKVEAGFDTAREAFEAKLRKFAGE